MSKDISNEDLSRRMTVPGQNSMYFNAMLAHGGNESLPGSCVNLRSSPVVQGVAPEPMSIYTVYVRYKDYARARQLVLEV
jgi:hypothetical protein